MSGQAGCGASCSVFCFLTWPVISSDGADRVRSVYFRHLVYIDQRIRLHRRFGILGEPSPCPHRTLCTENVYLRAGTKRKRSLISQASLGGGDSWTRTNDPIDVNDVLYRLSHATTLRFVVPSSSDYRLSHATTSAYLRPTSPVGHLEQFVLPTEPCDHTLFVKVTSVF